MGLCLSAYKHEPAVAVYCGVRGRSHGAQLYGSGLLVFLHHLGVRGNRFLRGAIDHAFSRGYLSAVHHGVSYGGKSGKNFGAIDPSRCNCVLYLNAGRYHPLGMHRLLMAYARLDKGFGQVGIHSSNGFGVVSSFGQRLPYACHHLSYGLS